MKKTYSRDHIKIWKQHYGKIPKDSDGRSYEIHHVDGNIENNDINNLRCVSIEEHFNIHKRQNEYGAAFLIARRMKINPEDISEIARQFAIKQLNEGTHNFQQQNFNRSTMHNKNFVVAVNIKTNEIVRVSKSLFDSTDDLVGINKNRKMKSIHNNRFHNKGKKWKQQNKEKKQKCKYCEFEGRGSHIKRYHNERCKKYNES